jgi:hypothetical protein
LCYPSSLWSSRRRVVACRVLHRHLTVRVLPFRSCPRTLPRAPHHPAAAAASIELLSHTPASLHHCLPYGLGFGACTRSHLHLSRPHPRVSPPALASYLIKKRPFVPKPLSLVSPNGSSIAPLQFPPTLLAIYHMVSRMRIHFLSSSLRSHRGLGYSSSTPSYREWWTALTIQKAMPPVGSSRVTGLARVQTSSSPKPAGKQKWWDSLEKAWFCHGRSTRGSSSRLGSWLCPNGTYISEF